MVTRTEFYADVQAELMYKDEAGTVVTDVIEDTLPKCNSEAKAQAILENEHKGKIVTLIRCDIRAEKRAMSDDDFYRYSHVVKARGEE